MADNNEIKETEGQESRKSVRKRVFELIQIGNRSDICSRLFDVFIVAIILLNISVTFALTFQELKSWDGILRIVEGITILIFLVEFLLRLWTADYLYPDKKQYIAPLAYLFSLSGIIDLLTILPYFMPFVFPSGAVAFRMFRVVRILHLFRINSKYDAFNVIGDVIKEKRNQLISSGFLILILLIASSLCMYDLEHEAQPEAFSNAFSGIWWSVSTLLTVGYGDIYPITPMGQVMAIVIAFLGVGAVAIPTGIISAGFVEYYTKIKTGAYAAKEADFVSLSVGSGHDFVGKTIEELKIPEGLYVAVLVRQEDVFTPYPKMVVEEQDELLLGTTGAVRIGGRLEEIFLERDHPWIKMRVKELDISRREFIVMIKRQGNNIKPLANTVLEQDDVVLMLEWKKLQNFGSI